MRTTRDLAPLQGSTIGLDAFSRDIPEAIKPRRIAIADSAVRACGKWAPSQRSRRERYSCHQRTDCPPTASTAVEVIYLKEKTHGYQGPHTLE
jgi:hypothetical protein